MRQSDGKRPATTGTKGQSFRLEGVSGIGRSVRLPTSPVGHAENEVVRTAGNENIAAVGRGAEAFIGRRNTFGKPRAGVKQINGAIGGNLPQQDGRIISHRHKVGIPHRHGIEGSLKVGDVG